MREERNLRRRGRFGPKIGPVAPGVWLLRGDLRGGMNVYFIEDGEGGVIQYDAGTAAMTAAVREAGAKLGGISRLILGHAHCDHRGTAAGAGVPVFCLEEAVTEARDPEPIRPYFELDRLEFAPVRWAYPHLLRRWDGGPVEISGMIEPGEQVAGFEVIDLSGHAPGMAGLWRESDRLALVSDTVYLVDPARLRELPEGQAMVPHAAFNLDQDAAREAVLRLAGLEPETVCAGHGFPLTGPGLSTELSRAAACG